MIKVIADSLDHGAGNLRSARPANVSDGAAAFVPLERRKQGAGAVDGSNVGPACRSDHDYPTPGRHRSGPELLRDIKKWAEAALFQQAAQFTLLPCRQVFARSKARPAVEPLPLQHRFDGREHRESQRDPDEFIHLVLGTAGFVPLAAERAVVDLEKEFGNEVIKRSNAAAGAHQQSGSKHFVAAVENHFAGLADLVQLVEIEVRELQSDDIGNLAEFEKMLESYCQPACLRIIVDQKRKAAGLRQLLVIAAQFGEVVVPGRRQTAHCASAYLLRVAGQLAGVREARCANVHNNSPTTRRAPHGRFRHTPSRADGLQNAFARLAAHVNAVDSRSIKPGQQPFKGFNRKLSVCVKRRHNRENHTTETMLPFFTGRHGYRLSLGSCYSFGCYSNLKSSAPDTTARAGASLKGAAGDRKLRRFAGFARDARMCLGSRRRGKLFKE